MALRLSSFRGVVGILGSTSSILETLRPTIQEFKEGVLFLNKPELIDQYKQKKVSIASNAETTIATIRHLFAKQKSDDKDADVKGLLSVKKRIDPIYIVVDLNAMQPVHFLEFMKLLQQSEQHNCLTIVLSAENLIKCDISVDLWIFPVPSLFLEFKYHEMLRHWALWVNISQSTFDKLILDMNDEMDVLSSMGDENNQTNHVLGYHPQAEIMMIQIRDIVSILPKLTLKNIDSKEMSSPSSEENANDDANESKTPDTSPSMQLDEYYQEDVSAPNANWIDSVDDKEPALLTGDRPALLTGDRPVLLTDGRPVVVIQDHNDTKETIKRKRRWWSCFCCSKQ